MEISINKTYKHVIGGFYTLIAYDFDTVTICRFGGGFNISVDKMVFFESFVRADIPDFFRQGVFSIEGSEPIVGWSNPNQRWNGWAQPAIKFNTLLRFCSLTEADLTKDDLGYSVNGGDYDGTVFIQCTISGFENYYHTDGWCWDDDTPEDPEERAELIAKLLKEAQ